MVMIVFIVLHVVLVGCDAEQPPTSHGGIMKMELTHVVDGTLYELRFSQFVVQSDSQYIVLSGDNLDVLEYDLEPGDYTVELQPGWQIFREADSGIMEPVDAVLSSENPVAFTIEQNVVTPVGFTFTVGEDAIPFGKGRLRLGIDIIVGNGTDTESDTATDTDPAVECVLPDFPPLDSLPRNEKLPDPFTFFNGEKVTTKAQWECRRREIQAMAAHYMYGPYPFEPDETTGAVSGDNISITCREGSTTESFSATITGSGDVITIDMTAGILPPSRKSLSFGAGYEDKIENLFGLTESINPNVAIGWMVDRVIEVLEQNPGSGHDPTKMAVSGCSGCGKGAFLVGVFSRIPMVVIVESGGGAGSSLRQAEWFRHGDGTAVWQCADALPQSIDNLEDNGICGPWVTSAATELRYNPDRVYNLPFDQHLLLATIAPRYLVHFTNDNGVNSWCHLGGTCEALSAWAAAPVWNALGVKDNMAFEMYSGMHCGAGDTGIASAMFQRAFYGDTSGGTGVVIIPADGVQQPVSEWEDMWIDWDMDTVLM
jgi:hypothetical protein